MHNQTMVVCRHRDDGHCCFIVGLHRVRFNYQPRCCKYVSSWWLNQKPVTMLGLCRPRLGGARAAGPRISMACLPCSIGEACGLKQSCAVGPPQKCLPHCLHQWPALHSPPQAYWPCSAGQCTSRQSSCGNVYCAPSGAIRTSMSHAWSTLPVVHQLALQAGRHSVHVVLSRQSPGGELCSGPVLTPHCH